MKPALRTVRIAEPAASQQKRVENLGDLLRPYIHGQQKQVEPKTLLAGKPYTPAAAHSDPRYMVERMAFYRQMVAKEKR